LAGESIDAFISLVGGADHQNQRLGVLTIAILSFVVEQFHERIPDVESTIPLVTGYQINSIFLND